MHTVCEDVTGTAGGDPWNLHLEDCMSGTKTAEHISYCRRRLNVHSVAAVGANGHDSKTSTRKTLVLGVALGFYLGMFGGYLGMFWCLT